MTTPREEQPQTEVAPAPSVSTAPPRSRWRFGNVPAHLGRARTSTVVLGVLFVGILVLWLFVRPETVQTTTTGTPGGVPAPTAPASTQAPQTSATPTTAPTTTTSPETTTEQTTTTEGTTSATTSSTTRSATPSRGTTASTSVNLPLTTTTAPTAPTS